MTLKLMVFMISLLFAISSFAEGQRVTIEYIELGIKSKELHLIMLSNGKVGVLKQGQMGILEKLKEHHRKDDLIEINLDSKHNIIGFKAVNRERPIEETTSTTISNQPSPSPTILPDMETTIKIFNKMNRGWQKESQCYNRAHIWNFEEFERSGLISKKTFIFFTTRYIRNYNFYWWFHAIPSVFVNQEGVTVERAMDPRYARSPLPMKTWSDIFIRSHRACPVISKYSDYRDNQKDEDCYIHPSTMFFWQPRDLDQFERTGLQKTNFIQSEINHAYWEAF